jgi:hypothetical protein
MEVDQGLAGREWVATYRLAAGAQGDLVVTQVSLRASGPDDPLGRSRHPDGRVVEYDTPGRGVTSRLLRQISPARAIQEAGDIMHSLGRHSGVPDWGDLMSTMSDQPTGLTRMEKLAFVAAAYTQALHPSEGEARQTNVNQVIAKLIGKRPEQVRELVRAARREGLLTQIPPEANGGRGGRGILFGELTPEGQKLCQEIYMAWLASQPDAGQVIVLPEALDDE